MARPATRPRRQGRAASPLVQRKSPRQPKRPTKVTVARELSSPIIQPIVRFPHKPKIRQTVSAAGIFKKQAKADRRSKKLEKRRESAKPDLLEDIHDGLAEARTAISDKGKASFDSIHTNFTRRLTQIRTSDETFFQRVSTVAKTLTISLEDEKVQTSFSKNGKISTEYFRVGDRVANFKKIIENEEGKLQELWKQWDEVQNEYLELGIDVFGERAFGVDGVGERGHKREMGLLGLEHDARVEEIEEEIESVGAEMMKKMKASEKDLDAVAKKDQARLLQSLL
ncbi:hypothetical protein VTL71DRAFT_11061 [Oculimacula yallundae]|uniref:Uncharacterized protein n=1 Tax=Oculimacula yallundae TaxID=86028 RepID=A0ABR4CV56_9HELO